MSGILSGPTAAGTAGGDLTGTFPNPTISKVSGTVTNDSASAGKVGEFISTLTARNAPVTLSTGATSNIASVALTAGDWDVSGIVGVAGTLTGTIVDVALSDTTAALPTINASIGTNRRQSPLMSTAVCDASIALPSFRVSLAAPATYYLVANATFTIGTATAYGRISARRMR